VVAGRSRAGDAASAGRRTPQQQRRRAFTVGLALLAVTVGIVGLVPEPDASADDTEVVMSAPPPTTAPATTTTTAAQPATEAPTTTEASTTTEAPTTTTEPSTTTIATTATTAPTTTTSAPPPPEPRVVAGAPTVGGDDAAFLACLRARESGGDYQAVSSTGLYFGAYQFMIPTWDSTASHAGRADLVGVRPDRASPADQDSMALALYRWQGKAPWNGAC
jgi:hypothetical protein